MDLNLIGKQPLRHGLLGVEKVTLIYTLFTALAIGVAWPEMTAPWQLLQGRIFVVAGILTTGIVYRILPCRASLFLRYFYPLSLLAYWYPDTYEFCQLLPNLDHLFAAADLALFGCQPSIGFSRLLPSKLWSELFHMGYFSYYPMIALTVFVPLFTDRSRFSRTAFVVMTSFFMYYLIYLFLPVAGPQYYFKAVGTETADTGIFPAVGYYFQTHTDMLRPEIKGIFSQLVSGAQEVGERPTAAFPSSHVGMSTVTMMLAWKARNRWLFWVMVPVYLLLCCATVYIQAHYLIDSIFGLISAVLFFMLTSWGYKKLRE